ncbi:MAG: ThiF family adenylyltransferase [Muribaculaceae bacterium]
MFKRLQKIKVIIFGLGGVGSWCAESLVRSGVCHITLVDSDRVDVTNINRQLPATTSTVGQVKVDVMKRRLMDINPDAEITSIRRFYTEETAAEFDLSQYDYVIDAIDSLKDKALLILRATNSGAKLFSSMGAALKVDAGKISVAEFWKVQGCPLAAALRRKFKRSGQFPKRKFKCVYSPELFRNRGTQQEKVELNRNIDVNNLDSVDMNALKAQINGTIAHTTAIFGFRLAGLVIEDLL